MRNLGMIYCKDCGTEFQKHSWMHKYCLKCAKIRNHNTMIRAYHSEKSLINRKKYYDKNREKLRLKMLERTRIIATIKKSRNEMLKTMKAEEVLVLVGYKSKEVETQ